MKIMEKWTSPNQNWASTLGQLTIMFGERIPNSYTILLEFEISSNINYKKSYLHKSIDILTCAN